MAAMAAKAMALGPAGGLAAAPAPGRVLQAKPFGVSTRLALRPSRGVVRATATAVDLEKLVSEVKSLTLEQARIFTDRLQEELGVSAAAMMPMGGAVAAPGGAAAEAAPAVEEKTEFDLVLEEVPSSSRIAVIKVVRSLTTLGLKEAKDLIEGLPKKVKEATAKEDAEEGKKALEAAGAKCSVV